MECSFSLPITTTSILWKNYWKTIGIPKGCTTYPFSGMRFYHLSHYRLVLMAYTFGYNYPLLLQRNTLSILLCKILTCVNEFSEEIVERKSLVWKDLGSQYGTVEGEIDWSIIIWFDLSFFVAFIVSSFRKQLISDCDRLMVAQDVVNY